MTDRSVRQVAPQPSQEEAKPRPFSTFLDRPSIVLLGNPGAGKSHLCSHFAAQVQVRPHKARSFLNAASINPSLPLFIDALDEKRAGRGDTTTVDAIIAKLNQWQPVQIRIACRAADWLGESDLAAFRDYFDEHGGYVVVALEKLTRDEQRAVLGTVRREHPDAFLDEAAARGLQDLTDNPQNLRMLHEAVKSGTWPATRRELYEISADLLLTEHNTEHSRRGAGTYTPAELHLPAGALFAARLISDVDGISLTETPVAPDFPSYRTSPVTDLEEAKAVLSRPIFASAALTETADYTHRTVAEYLAAAWLAHQIRSGLPLGRVLALIGVEGHPASELRGLHAWLPIFLPEHAPTFIEVDPFGVLTYADAASLSPQNRQYIVSALARLSEQNPWFRGGDWDPTRIGALSGPDMLEAFAPSSAPTPQISLLGASSSTVSWQANRFRSLSQSYSPLWPTPRCRMPRGYQRCKRCSGFLPAANPSLMLAEISSAARRRTSGSSPQLLLRSTPACSLSPT